MKYLIPVLMGGAAISVTIITAVAQAHGAFTGNASLKPYLYGYGAAATLLLIALIFAINAGRQESKASDTSKHKEITARELVIHYAGWGLGPEQYEDVTTVVKANVRDNKIDIPVENATFQCHPYPGLPKKLFVRYSFGLGSKEKTKLEHDRLNLP